MQTREIKNKLELLLAVCILGLFYLPNLSAVEFHNDESQWIATSNVFETYLRLDLGSSLWNKSYWTLTQPPMVRYVIGLGRYLGGYHIPDLNKPWDFNRGVEYNTRQGAMPSDGLLWWSRLPMAILAVASFFIVFLLLMKSWGRFAAYIWLGLVSFNPYFLLQLRRAMGESSLLFFTTVTLYAVYRALQVAEQSGSGDKRAVYLWLGVAGAASGLAGASKLNGLANVLAPVLASVVVALRSKAGNGAKLRTMIAGSGLAGLGCAALFVGLNPFLWPNPVGRTIQMFQHRLDEMTQQTTTHPVDYISNWSQRLQIIPMRIFADYAALPISFILNLALFIGGLVLLSYVCVRWLQAKEDNFAAFAWLISAGLMAIPPLFTIIDWDRYYLFPVFFSTVFGAIILGWLGEQAFRLLVARLTPQSLS